MEIDIPGGQKVEITDETTAKLIIAMRDALKSEAKEAREKLATIEQEAQKASKAKADAEAAAKAAAEQAEVQRLKQAGEFEKAMELQKAQAEAKLSTIRTQLVRKDIHAMVASRDNVVKTAIPDIIEALANKFRLGDDGNLQTEDGVAADAALEQYFSARPHLVVANLPAGSPTTPKGVTSGLVTKITQAELERQQTNDRSAYRATVDAIQSGAVQVTNE